jgi:hypothetical protein
MVEIVFFTPIQVKFQPINENCWLKANQLEQT